MKRCLESTNLSQRGFINSCLLSQDKIFGGIGKLFKDDNCGCPCREYYVPKCVTEYREQCYQVKGGGCNGKQTRVTQSNLKLK